MYDAIDECLDEYDGKRAYELIKEMISAGDQKPDAELEYRFAHACYILSNFHLSNEEERYRLLEEAYVSCKMACKPESKNSELLKWSAIITGTLAELKNINDAERVVYVKEFKKFLDEALACAPDSSVYHMNGRFCYRMATLSEEEKEHVIAAFQTVPTSTIDEALDNFQKAEELNPGHIDNLMYLGKCYIAKGDHSQAEKYLLSVLEMTPVDEMDEAQIAEAQQLLISIDGHLLQDKQEKHSEDEMPVEIETDYEEISTATESSHLEEKTDATN